MGIKHTISNLKILKLITVVKNYLEIVFKLEIIYVFSLSYIIEELRRIFISNIFWEEGFRYVMNPAHPFPRTISF